MKKAFLNKSMNIIKNNSSNISEERLAEIRYGLENFYLSITKLILILIVTALLGIVKEFIVFLLLYNVLRLFAFGMHASKTYICLIISGIIFITLPYIATILVMPVYLKVMIYIFCMLMIVLYAPADTHRRPIIKAKRRLVYKVLSTITCAIFIVISFVSKNTFLSNCLILSLITEVALILPITYKLFRMPYKNYLTYRSRGA